jgi:hypothetical protein
LDPETIQRAFAQLVRISLSRSSDRDDFPGDDLLHDRRLALVMQHFAGFGVSARQDVDHFGAERRFGE